MLKLGAFCEYRMNSFLLQQRSSKFILILIFVCKCYSAYAEEMCEELPEILNADPDLQGLRFPVPIGTNISFICHDGYILSSNGSAYSVCLHNNETAYWLPKHVICEPACQDLPVVQHGDLKLDDRSPPFLPEESIRYICSSGYKPPDHGVPEVTCKLQDGIATWIQPVVPCRPTSCSFPGDIENSYRVGRLFTFPNNVTYVCNEGYKMRGTPTIFCMATGVWRPSLPSCEAIICPLLSHPEHGKVISSERRYNAIASYECNRNYNLKGSAERVCQTDGTWSDIPPVCEEIFCLHPGSFPNGRVLPNRTIYRSGDFVIFKCNNDDQTHTSKCLEIGIWNKRPPICTGSVELTPTSMSTTSSTPMTLKPTTDDISSEKDRGTPCVDPGDINNGRRKITGITPNSTLTYTCEDGYDLRGKGTLFCLENGKWNLDKLPICVQPISVQTIIGIVIGVILIIASGVGGYFCYMWREKKLRGYGKKSKALTADATDMEEIAGLEKGKKPIPVTVL